MPAALATHDTADEMFCQAYEEYSADHFNLLHSTRRRSHQDKRYHR